MGSSNKGYKQAKRDEEAKQREIQLAQRRIEGIFNSPERDRQIQDFIDATRGFYVTDLDRQHGDAGRNLKFALARSGLSGGSVDVDKQGDLAETYLRNLLGVERKAQGAGSNLRAQDQATQSSLMNQILAGLDVTTAATRAGHAMQNNVSLAESEAYQANLNDLFGNLSPFIKSSKEAAGDRRAAYDFNTIYGNRQRPIAPIAGGVYGGAG
jgi:hypothetical protein